jgi:hypothetical protein
VIVASVVLNLALLLPTQAVTVGMPFLKLGVGARPAAMGEAFSAVADDANAMFWNPGAMGMMDQFDVSIMLMNLYGAVTYTSGAAVFPISRRKKVSMGAAIAYLSATDTLRDEYGNTQGQFSLYDFLGAAGVGWRFNRYVSFGASGKFVYSKIYNYDAWSLLGDFGVKANPTKHLYLGLVLQNLGTPRRFIYDIEVAPTTIRGGLALLFPFQGSHFLFTSDLAWPIDDFPTVGLGGELKIYFSPEGGVGSSGIAIRGGYRSGYHLGTWGGFSFGLGYEYEFSKLVHISLDAVYFSYGFLGDSERLSLGLNFRPN